jgi:hypothetical protein
MAYTKKQAAAKPGLQRIRNKKKNAGGGLTRLDKPGKPKGPTRTVGSDEPSRPMTRPRPGQGGPKPKPIKRAK